MYKDETRAICSKRDERLKKTFYSYNLPLMIKTNLFTEYAKANEKQICASAFIKIYYIHKYFSIKELSMSRKNTRF